MRGGLLCQEENAADEELPAPGGGQSGELYYSRRWTQWKHWAHRGVDAGLARFGVPWVGISPRTWNGCRAFSAFFDGTASKMHQRAAPILGDGI